VVESGSRLSGFCLGPSRGRVQSRGSEKQRSEVWCLAANVPGCVDSIEFSREGASCEATVQTVLRAPGRTFVSEVKAVSASGMTEKVVDRSKPVKCATELAIEKRMKALPNGDG
jgi:hypothetical protein